MSTSMQQLNNNTLCYYQTLLREKIENGRQFGALRLIASGIAVPADLIRLIKSPAYQNNHPQTYAILKSLADAYGRYIGGKAISQMNAEEKTQALYSKIKLGKHIGALDLIAHGAKFNQIIVDLLEDPTFQTHYPVTYNELKPYLQYYKQQRAVGLIPRANNSIASVVVNNQPYQHVANEELMNNYYIGDGGFGSKGLNHNEIERIKRETRGNPVLDAAYHLLEGYDHAQLNDVDYLTDFLHNTQNNSTIASIIESMKADKRRCKEIAKHLTNAKGGNMAQRHAMQKLGTNVEWNMLDEGIKLLRNHPQIAKGILPKPFHQYRGYELCALKTALVYSAANKGATAEDLKHLKGFYRLELPNNLAKAAGSGMKIRFGDTMYVPSSGYFFGADQRLQNENGNDDAFIADCSGTIINLIRDLKPELTWFKNHRVGTWDLQYAHDDMVMNNIAHRNQGPIKDSAGHHRTLLTSYEMQKARNASSKIANKNIKAAMEVVYDRDDIKPGDIILWRKPNGEEGGGHVGIVVEYEPGSNDVVIMHDTMGAERFGVGLSKEKVFKTTRETRILRMR